MKFGIDMPIPPCQGIGAETIIDWVVEAEQAGWDSISLWDHLLMDYPTPSESFDSWTLYSGIASRTNSIKLGPAMMPLPRKRPWRVARESVTLDHLSNGRLIMGAVIGHPPHDFSVFGEPTDPKIRTEMLEESLDIIVGLWSGESFSYDGKHYHLDEVIFLPKPIQKPRIPIWIGGTWPFKTSYKRAAKWNGVAPIRMWPETLSPDDLRAILDYISSHRGNLKNFEVIVTGNTTGNNSSKDEDILRPWIDAGATWWSEMINAWRGKPAELIERIRKGPPEV